MLDSRISRLAQSIITHSCDLRDGERVMIESINAPRAFVLALIEHAARVGAIPYVWLKDDEVIRATSAVYDDTSIRILAENELATLVRMNAFVGVRAVRNAYEYTGVPRERMERVREHYVQPVHFKHKHNNLKWLALRWPTAAFAQRARMSSSAFEDYFFAACLFDHAKLGEAMAPLEDLMSRTCDVRIVGPGETDLCLSIANMPSFRSAGKHNLPDGELFTAPMVESVCGRIVFNVPSTYYATTFHRLDLSFKDGRVIAAASDDPQALNALLDQDAGARSVGEFAFGLNPLITSPIDDILFDEKMAGTLHLALGNAYSIADNGNRSSIHWDLILDQRPAAGGGRVYFDGVLIRENGRFVLRELEGLNPDSLLLTSHAGG